MEKYLSKFTNLSDYINFRNTDIPAVNVSYVESIDKTIYYNDGTDKAHRNFYFKVLNPENITQWDTDENGKEYISINPAGSLGIRVYYLTNGELRGSDNNLFKLYKDSDYTITILYQEAGGHPGIKYFGNPADNTFGLRYKVGGNIYSWFMMNGQDLDTFTLQPDWDYSQFTQFFESNYCVLDFSDLYIPSNPNYKYGNMFKQFNIQQNDTLIMPDIYINGYRTDSWNGQFLGMFGYMPVSNFGLYLSGVNMGPGAMQYMFQYSTFTTVPKIIFELNDGGHVSCTSMFEGNPNLTDIWVPNMNYQNKTIVYDFSNMYADCDSLTDLSSYVFDFTKNENLQHGYVLNGMFSTNGTGSLTKAPKILVNVWGNNSITLDNIFGNQTNLSEIYLLGNNLADYNSDNDTNRFIDHTSSLPASGTVYVTDTTVDINTLNAKFGIPTTWTLAIYSE